MASADARTRDQDVFLSDARSPESVLAGLVLTDGVTHENFHQMIEVLLVVQGKYFIQDENGQTIDRDATPLARGNYLLVADGAVSVSDEKVLLRAISADGTRDGPFSDAVRSRDGGCVVTGLRNASHWQEWLLWDCSHMFPPAHERVWEYNDYGRWVNIVPETGGAINSVQNGLCLSKNAHALFDSYYFSINPDVHLPSRPIASLLSRRLPFQIDRQSTLTFMPSIQDQNKIICFQKDDLRIAGRHLDPGLAQDPLGPSVNLLRWHFRQAVLANMRGAGEPIYEHDFPLGTDMVGEILSGPKPAERMEFELFSRLGSNV